MATSLLTPRHLIAIGSAVLLLALGAAFFLVYQNAAIMLDQIQRDFNQEQLILARQASARIRANLDDLVEEMAAVRLAAGASRPEAAERALATAFEHTRRKGVVDLGLFEPGHPPLRPTLAGLRLTPDERLAQDCQAPSLLPPRLHSVRVEAEGAGRVVVALFCLPVASDGRRLFAVIDVSLVMARALGDIRSGRTGYAWAIDRSGMFLYHPERDFIGRSAFEARHERQPYISFSQINRIMQERMLRGAEGTGTYVSGWHRGEQGQITKLIAFTPVESPALAPDEAWSVAVVAPVAEIAEAVHGLYVRQIAAEALLIAGMFAVGVLGVLYQRRLSQALARQMGRQEQYMSSILQNSVDAIVFVDNDNRVQVWNEGAERIFGYRSAEMAGQTFHRLVPPDVDAEAELRRINDAIRTRGYVKDYVAPRVTKDGRRITVDISRTDVRDDGGRVIGSTVIIRDVTEKMELEQKIYSAEKLASIGILAAGVAHEINNPLAIMLGFTDLLRERFQPGSPEYRDLQMIADNGEHARKIVQDLLGFARITEGLEDTVDVPRCVDRVIGIVRNTLLTRKIELALDVPESLPRVCGDAREFQQVVFNLVNNAVAAMQGAGRLTIRARCAGAAVELAVEDTGPGIPEGIRARVFDPFFTTKRAGEGTGLGLSLCYGIVRKYGGAIAFTSVAEGDPRGLPSGTTFTVSMPVCATVAAGAGVEVTS